MGGQNDQSGNCSCLKSHHHRRHRASELNHGGGAAFVADRLRGFITMMAIRQ